jgi:hypothetical protein
MWAVSLALVGMIPLLFGWESFPDPMAVHWGPGGQPDGAMDRGLIWLVPLVLTSVGLALGVLLRVDGSPSAEGVALVGFFGGMAIWTSLSLAILNRDAGVWQEAGAFDLWQVVGVVVTGVVFGAIGVWLGRRWYPLAPRPVIDAPAMEFAPEERVAWMGTARVMWPFLILSPFGLVFLLLPGWLKILAPVYVVLAYLISQVSVLVDANGMKVRLGGILTVRKIALEEVDAARAIHLEPTQWGGWGYRMIPGATAVVLRRGDGIEVVLEGGRRFGVTVDDAATGAAVLNGLVRRQASSA